MSHVCPTVCVSARWSHPCCVVCVFQPPCKICVLHVDGVCGRHVGWLLAAGFWVGVRGWGLDSTLARARRREDAHGAAARSGCRGWRGQSTSLAARSRGPPERNDRSTIRLIAKRKKRVVVCVEREAHMCISLSKPSLKDLIHFQLVARGGAQSGPVP